MQFLPLILLAGGLVYLHLALYRNNAVYKYRKELIDKIFAASSAELDAIRKATNSNSITQSEFDLMLERHRKSQEARLEMFHSRSQTTVVFAVWLPVKDFTQSEIEFMTTPYSEFWAEEII